MKVGIVGLGPAGLRAAMLLDKAGIELELYDARDRVGGRVHTVDAGGGAVFEGGGEWIDADHYRVLDLLSEVGVEPTVRQEWPGKVVCGGKHVTEATLWNDALEDELRVEATARERARELYDPPWSNDQRADWDDYTVAEFVGEHTSTDRGRWWVTANIRSDEGEDLDRISLLGWLTNYRHYLERDGDVVSAHRVHGGFSGLFRKMLDGLGTQPRLNHALRRVRQTGDGVLLTFDHTETKVDRVLLTMPPPCVEQIVFEPALSVTKRCAIEGCEMGRAIKICLEFETPWWQDQGWGGSMKCDGPIQQTWEASFGSAHLLVAYVCGSGASEWAGLPDPVKAAAYELAKIVPEASSTFRRGWFVNWLGDPFARGGFPYIPKGFVLEHMEHISSPEGRIHFAGDATSTWTGFIEGALESAERAAQEIVNS